MNGNETIVDAVSKAVINASTRFREDQIKAYEEAIEQETDRNARWVLKRILENGIEAEREKRAAIAESEGHRQAVINVAEGDRQQAIELSQGEKQKRINEAEGRAKEILLVAEATAEGLKMIAMAIEAPGGAEAVNLRVAEQYIGEFGNLAKKNNTIILPENLTDVAGIVATAKALLKEPPRQKRPSSASAPQG